MEKTRIYSRAKQGPSTILKAIELESRRIGPKRRSSKKKLFNLDLHTSVIRDIQFGLNSNRVSLTNWSISRHNDIFRNFFKYPDPVRFINARNWTEINEKSISKFVSYYAEFLKQFDGFVVTHTPVFAEIFKSLEKPILVINSTRYESPYTNDQSSWGELNSTLVRGLKDGQFLIYSNNSADSKYLNFFTGIESEVVPSICDYTQASWQPRYNKNVYFSNRQTEYVKNELGKLRNWASSEEVFGKKFDWGDLQYVNLVFIIPYNVSTMQLFELSTAGIPVVVPSRSFLIELFQHGNALGEISFFQIHKLDTNLLSEKDPNNFNSPAFLDFWLEVADFYNRDLMPNVFFVDSFEELETFNLQESATQISENVHFRNEKYLDLRENALSRFLDLL
jgi:hypothetical protein